MSDRINPERTVPGKVIVLPMLVFSAAVISIAAYWLFTQPKSPPAPPPSIAALPFDSPDRNLGETVARSVLEKLTGVPGFTVTPTEQSFPAAGSDAKAVGTRLNVRSVLEGSIAQTGDRVTVKARLINSSDGFALWSQQYDRNASDLPAIESEIAQSIMKTLGLKR
jgi:TolB-like protein